jgi:hypothetical protein
VEDVGGAVEIDGTARQEVQDAIRKILHGFGTFRTFGK